MMKTYTLTYAFIALFIFGCSTSEDDTDDDDKIEQSVEADYTLLVNTGGMLTGKLLNGDAETLSVNDGESGFAAIAEPQLISEEGEVLTMYHKKSNCGGTITVHDFNDATSKSFDVFADLGTCNLTAEAIVKGGNTIYVAYKKEISAEITEFAVRAMEISGAKATFEDVALDYNPVGLAFSNNRLFIMGFDEDISGEHKLTVLSADTNTEIFEDNLGFDAQSIFKNPEGNIIVGYDNLHTTINSKTFAKSYTTYAPGSVPNFATSELRHFDSNGKMYYAMLAGTYSKYSLIPAVYDFNKNSAILYAFENFLTETQLDFELEIENTTLVHYDEANNLLLIGYKKSGDDKKGGLLRINPVPQPKFAGNLDLDGIPYALYVD
ncbi:MAG TPA: hypothetical protein VFD35_05675 [Pricia sp.]|nr:hypothetical protein [Pricia sp.]